MSTTNTRRYYLILFMSLVLSLTLGALAIPQRAYAKYEPAKITTQSLYPYFDIVSPAFPNNLDLGQKKITFEAKFTSDYKENKYSIWIENGEGEVICTFDDHKLTYVKDYSNSVYDSYIGIGEKLKLEVDTSNWKPDIYYFKANAYFYSFYEWRENPSNPISGGYPFHVNGITETNLSVESGKSVDIPRDTTRNQDMTFEKVSGNNKIKVTKKGTVKVSKSLQSGVYKVRVKAYISGNHITTKTLRIYVKHIDNLVVKTKKLTIAPGKSKKLSYSPKKGVTVLLGEVESKNIDKYYPGKKYQTLLKYIKISKNGNITINKKLKKGTYKVQIWLYKNYKGVNNFDYADFGWMTLVVK